MNNFSENLSTLMNTRKISQLALAREAGISQAAISRYLKGATTPSAHDLCSLADYFGISMDSLWKPTAYPQEDNQPHQQAAPMRREEGQHGSVEDELNELKHSLRVIFRAMTEPAPNKSDTFRK